MSDFFTNLSPLERYGHNLTQAVSQEAYASLVGVGYEIYVEQVFQTLLRKTRGKCNPLLLSSDERMRMQIVTEVAHRMAIGRAPSPLIRCQIIALNYEALFARQEKNPIERIPKDERDLLFSQSALEQEHILRIVFSRLQNLLLAVRQAQGETILFIDHLYRILGFEDERYAIDATSLLIPALARREVQMIGACTLAQYRKHIERFAAISCRFQEICLPL